MSKIYTITQEQMDRLHGAAHSGGMLGGQAAYEGCLKVGAILAEIAFKEGFDKSPGSAPEGCEANPPRVEPRRDIWMDGYWKALNENTRGADTSQEKHEWRKAAYERHQAEPGPFQEREK